MNDSKILLHPKVDTNDITKTLLPQIQNLLDKQPLNLKVGLDRKTLSNAIKTIAPALETELRKLTGIEINVNDENISKVLSQISKETNSMSTNLEHMQNWLDNNTKSLQELRNALISYQDALKNTDSSDTSILSNIESVVTDIDELQKALYTFKNVGRGKMFPLIHCYCFENADYNMCSLGY